MTNVLQGSERHKRKNSMIVHLLVTVFGISTWIGINGIYVQLPVLISISPEGWTLPSYLVLVVQSANVGPLLYLILQHFQWKINESWWILCLLFLGSCAMGFLTFFHSEKTIINGIEYSLILFILTFFNALVGCFSSVLFMPYLRKFKENYLISFFIGEGLSGVLPSVVALIQGVTDSSECTTSNDNTTDSLKMSFTFSSSDYFLFIFIILFLSLTAFIILEYSSLIQSTTNVDKSDSTISNETPTRISNEFNDKRSINHVKGINKVSDLCNINDNGLITQMQCYLFVLLTICCFFSNGFFPSIQSYSCLPYGNVAYKLSVTFSQFANPLVCLLAYWFVISDVKHITYLSVVCLTLGSYVTYLALMSPAPPLQETTIGIFLIVIVWTILVAFISYLKLIIVSVLRNTMLPAMLLRAGTFMQIGSASGAIFSFLVINFTDYFKMSDYCNP